MKKIKTIFSLVLVTILCVSMCGCSVLDMLKDGTYNTGSIKDGFSKISSIDGVEFVVPSDLRDEAIGEAKFIEMSLEALEDEEVEEQMKKVTFEIKNDTQYVLLNYSKGIILVAPITSDEHLKDIENLDDFEDAIELSDDTSDVEYKGSFVKTTSKGVSKIIVDAEITLDDAEFNGYVAVIENENNDLYAIVCGHANEDENDNMKYIAKSLKYNGDDVAQPETDEEEEDEDDEDFIIDEDDIELEDGVEIEIGNTDDEDEDTNSNNNSSTDKNTSSNTGVSSDIKNATLKSWKVEINGKTVTFPISYEEFIQITGAKPAYDDEESTELKPNNYDIVQLTINDVDFSVNVVNTTESNINVTKGKVFGFGADRYDLYGYGGTPVGDNRFVLPGGIAVYKSTKADVISAYGQPTKENETDSFIYMEYDLAVEEYFDYSKMEIQIEKATGLVYGFDYDNYNVR